MRSRLQCSTSSWRRRSRRRCSSSERRCAIGTRIHNAAVVVHRRRVFGVAPEVVSADLREVYERRQLPGDDVHGVIQMGDVNVPFGPGLLFTATDMPGFVLHVEICEDMFVPGAWR